MKKRMAIICLCLLVGCLLLGIMIAGVFRETNWQAKLTEEEKAELIRIALNDTSVKEMLEDKEHRIIGAGIISRGHVVSGDKTREAYPGVQMYVGEDNWMKITLTTVLIDLDKKKVIQIYRYPYVKPTIPGGVTREEKEEAIRIALNNKSVKERIEGLEYEVRDVLAFEKWMTGEKLDTDDVYIHINGTPICYIATVNLTERRVIAIKESIYGPVDKKRSGRDST